MNRTNKIALILLSCSVGILSLYSCKKKVESIKPQLSDITESVYANGIVTALNQYSVQPSTSGILQQVLVREGDRVSKGQALFLIKNNTTQLMEESARIDADFNTVSNQQDRLAEVRLQIQSAKSKLEYDSAMYARQLSLVQQDAGAQAELDTRKMALTASRNNYNALQLQLQNLTKQLKYSQEKSRTAVLINQSQNKDFVVKSMINGTVFKINYEIGSMVGPQMTLATVGDHDEYKLEMQVDERDILSIKIDQEVIFTFDTDKGKPYRGKITKIIPLKNERTKTFTVEAALTEAVTLYPNLSFEANIVIAHKEKALLIPRNYLINNNQVLTADKKKITVTTGLKNYEMVEILKGIDANTELILSDEL